MAEELKVRLNLRHSDDEDHEALFQSWPEIIYRLDAFETLVSGYRLMTTASSVPTTNGGFTAAEPCFAMFYNADPANYVDMAYRSIGGGSTTQTCRVYPGDVLVVPDLDTVGQPNGTVVSASVLVHYLIAQE